MPAFRKVRQEDCTIQASKGYTARSWVARRARGVKKNEALETKHVMTK